MELIHYLQPPKKNWITCPGISTDQSLGTAVEFNDGTEEWWRRAKMDVAIVGVPEGRNSAFLNTHKGPALLRKWLYGMRNISADLRIADLGDILGNSLNDRYQALSEVVELLTKANVQVLLIGGSQELTLPASKFFRNHQRKYNIAVFDSFLDIDTTNQDFSASTFISYLLGESGGNLDEISVLGCQVYYCSTEQETFMRNHHFPVVRLRNLRGGKIERCEVFLRDADLMSFDMSAIQGQPGYSETMLMPNGFSHEEACRIFWYAGASDNLKVAGLFNLSESEDTLATQSPLAAQMFWHFLEGHGARWRDFPYRSIEDYELKVVYLEEFDEHLSFYFNSENNRWWIKVPHPDGEKIVACHPEDYEMALEKDLPEVWWRYFLKTNGNSELNKR